MPRATWNQQNFNGGEWSPLMLGRTQLDRYKNALALCRNWIPMAQGPLQRRPGFQYVAATKNNGAARLVRFEFSVTQAYILEFGANYIRFYTLGGQLLNGGNPYEVTTTYAANEIWGLGFTQSADTLFIFHPNHAPALLVRLGATNWTLSNQVELDGPYLPQNTTSTTLTASATTGSVTITASSTTGINNNTGFQSNDVGRMLRILVGANWGWATITGYTSTTVVTASVATAAPLGGTTATANWRLGAWGGSNGYPAVGVFHEDRLYMSGCPALPMRVDGSNSSDYGNFAPSNLDGTVPANKAVSLNLNANEQNVVRWLQSDEKGLLVGTAGGEWLIRSTSTLDPISPTNVNAKQSSRYGSAALQSLKVGRNTLFIQRDGRKLREMSFLFQIDGFQAIDISLMAEHLTKGGVVQMALQKTPQQIIWMVRSDGTLISITYEKEQDINGWAQHVIGGFSDSGQSVQAIVESVECIPSSDATRDDVWVVVNRYINGGTVRYVEIMSKMWATGDSLTTLTQMDCAVTYNGAATTTVTGLTMLKGQTVQILADGTPHPDVVVDSTGAITLQRSASVINIGLHKLSEGQTLRIEAGGADGTSQGKWKRIHRAYVRLKETLGFNIGTDPTNPQEIEFRSSADRMDGPPALFTGDKDVDVEGVYENLGQLYFSQAQPLPATLAMIVVKLETQDGG